MKNNRTVNDGVRFRWEYLPAVVCGLARCWPILLVPVLLALIAIKTEQGRDAVAAAASYVEVFGKGYHAYAAQAVTTVLTTVTAAIVLTRYLPTRPATRYAGYHVPGLVGLIAGFAPIVVLQETGALAHEAPEATRLFVIVGSLTVPAWVIGSRHLLWAASWASCLHAAGWMVLSAFTVGCVAWITDYWPIPFLFAVAVLIFADLIEWRHARSVPRQWFAVIVACITLVGAALVAVGPVNWGLAIGSYAVLQVALNFWLGAAFLLYLVARTLAGSRKVRSVRGVLPASITMLLLWLFFTGPFDLREVRLLDSQRIASPATGLRQQATAWLEARRKEISESSACYPVFVVNADGGGVRAAWWSATILSTLQDREGKFSEHVFAISGVSGGSLGAAVFAARAAHSPSPGKPCAQTWRSCTDAVLARDLLGPAVGSMIISDAFGAITRLDLLQDRATALEKAFESAWLDASGHDTFGEPFEMLWGGDGATRVPSLMLNATDAPNARRLVLSPVPLFRGDTDKADLGVLLGTRALRLSTAVLLSARFPGISPAGWLPAPEGPAGHGTAIVDGGFVDNSGARSASEAVAALHAAAETLGLPKVLPVALMIGNTPVSSNSPPDVSAPGTRSAFAATTFGSLISPVLTLEGLRQLSAVQAKREYRATVAAAGGLVLDGFDLRADGGTYPLGWMLAEGTRKDMGRQIDEMTQDSSSHFAVAAGLLRRCRRDR